MVRRRSCDVLVAASTPEARTTTRCTFTLAQSIESVRSVEEQGLVIDSLPLLTGVEGASSLSRLFAAIEVLRDEVKVTELMHSAVASSGGRPVERRTCRWTICSLLTRRARSL